MNVAGAQTKDAEGVFEREIDALGDRVALGLSLAEWELEVLPLGVTVGETLGDALGVGVGRM